MADLYLRWIRGGRIALVWLLGGWGLLERGWGLRVILWRISDETII